MKTTNMYGATIIENRYIGKTQLTADDLGGADCSTWIQYRQICDNIVFAANNRLAGKGITENALGASVAALFTFFGVDAKATEEYQSRLLASTIARKGNRSDLLKNKTKDRNKAKKAWEEAVANEAAESEIATLKEAYEALDSEVKQLYTEPNNFWYDLVPMLDTKKKHATAAARKSIEDVIADIINERALMTTEELQAEAQRLADERKGREVRRKAANKAAKTAA